MSTFTIIVNESLYLGERNWNSLRFAKKSLESGLAVNFFLMADAVYIARRSQRPPEQAPNL
jgi:sulfur relay (sulfurtransferase) complex TusBCD TusD component (DsrE family)